MKKDCLEKFRVEEKLLCWNVFCSVIILRKFRNEVVQFFLRSRLQPIEMQNESICCVSGILCNGTCLALMPMREISFTEVILLLIVTELVIIDSV